MSTTNLKAKREAEELPAAIAPTKLEADGGDTVSPPLAATTPSVAETSSAPAAKSPTPAKSAKAAAVEPAPAPEEAVSAPAPSPDPPTKGIRRYRVWAHGTFQRDGITYQPGDELTLHEDVGSAIGCLEPV